MRVLKALLVVSAVFLLLLVGVLLTVNNQQQVVLDLVFVQLPQASIARWLVLSFLAGAVISFFVASVTVMVMKARLAQTRRSVKQLERQLDKLKMAQLNQVAG